MPDGAITPDRLIGSGSGRRVLDLLDDINRGIEAFWPLNESGGTVARDIGPKRYNGTLTNFSSTSTSGWGVTRLGRTLQFDGTNDRIPISNIPTPSAITISAWVIANASTQGFIINKTFDGSTVPFSLSVNPSSFAAGFAGYWNNGWRSSGVATDIRGDGKWHHVAGSYDGATLRFYVDGKLDSSASYATTLPSSTATTYIGTYFGDGIYFGGSMSALRLHRRVLSIAELRRLCRDPWAGTHTDVERLFFLARSFGGPVASVSLTGIALPSYAGTVRPGIEMAATGSAATASAGTPTAALTSAVTGSASTSAAGTTTPGIGVSLTGTALTMSAGSLAYSIAFTLTGQASAAASGTIGTNLPTVRTLTGIQLTAVPGNVRVTGGTRWRPQEAQAVTPPSTINNTLPPPPRATGNAQADLIALQQWTSTFYDQFVKANNVFGQIARINLRLDILEEK